MRRHLKNSRRGYAIIVVLSVIAMMTIYLAAAHSSILTQASQSKVQIERLKRIEATETALESARRSAEGTIDLPSEGHAAAGTAQWHTLTAQDPIWATLPGITPRAGDRLMTIEWGVIGTLVTQERFLFNPARGGAVRLANAKP